MQNSRRTRFAARCYAYTACSEFLSENRPRFSDATRLDRCRFGMDATSVPCLSRRLEWSWMPSKSASIVLALCGGRLLEFPAAQAAASVTAAWNRAENSGRWAGGGRTACASCTRRLASVRAEGNRRDPGAVIPAATHRALPAKAADKPPRTSLPRHPQTDHPASTAPQQVCKAPRNLAQDAPDSPLALPGQ